MDPVTFVARLEQDDGGSWWYLHVPRAIRDGFKHLERHGVLAVTAQVGESRWDGSLLPWADGSAQISVNKRVRTKEGLRLHDDVSITITPRERSS